MTVSKKDIKDISAGLSRFFYICSLIFSERPRVGRYSYWRLFCEYLRLKLKQVFIFRMFRREIKHEKLLGYKVSFPNYWYFVFLFEEIFIMQIYYFISNNISPYIIDCGANIGMSIIFFKLLYPNARITAFEPDEVVFRYLKENVKDNDLKDVLLYQKAVFNNTGRVDFFCDNNRGDCLTKSLLPLDGCNHIGSVEAVRLSSFIKDEISFLKVDVEGVEYFILRELEDAQKLGLINKMVVEYHHHIKKGDDSLGKFLSILEENGFGYNMRVGTPCIDRWQEMFQDIVIYAYNKKYLGR